MCAREVGGCGTYLPFGKKYSQQKKKQKENSQKKKQINKYFTYSYYYKSKNFKQRQTMQKC